MFEKVLKGVIERAIGKKGMSAYDVELSANEYGWVDFTCTIFTLDENFIKSYESVGMVSITGSVILWLNGDTDEDYIVC